MYDGVLLVMELNVYFVYDCSQMGPAMKHGLSVWNRTISEPFVLMTRLKNVILAGQLQDK